MQIDFQSKKMTIILGSIMAILILVIAAVSYFFLINPAPSIKVIDFTNKPLTEVKQWMQDNEVDETLYQISYEYNDTIEKEHVVSQNLKVDEYITEETILKLIVSNGLNPDSEVNLIDFTGKTEEEVLNWFTENKFSDVSVEYVLSDKVEKGKFVKLNTTATTAKRSDLIMISISMGKDAVGLDITMPDFKDYTKENIQAWAKTNIMSLTFTEQNSDTIASGKVIDQTPKAGEKTKTGGKVNVTISIGKGIKAVSQIGKSQSEAVKWATNNGLKYSIQEYYSAKPKGTIIDQTVTKGTIKPGATIGFGVSVGQIPVQDFTGKQKNDFVQHINGLNTLYNKSAKLSVSFTEEDSNASAGSIIAISINGVRVTSTLMVDPGSNIKVILSKGKLAEIANYAGKNEADLLKHISDNGMVAGTKTQRYHDSIGNGLIIANDSGSKAQGSSINYTVSLGAFNLDAGLYARGKSYHSLKETIDKANGLGAGWSIASSEVESKDLDKGLIEACTVSGKTVNCQVSKGVFNYITVPNLAGKPSPCGTNRTCTIENITYTITYEEGYNDNVAKDIVVRNDKAGEQVLNSANITVVLSRGPKPKVACPADSTGSYQPDCTCNNPDYSYDSNSNTCVLTYVTTPNVGLGIYSGNSYEDAVNNVKNAYADINLANNLSFIKVSPEENSGSSPGRVVEINPKPGSRVHINDTITVKIVGN